MNQECISYGLDKLDSICQRSNTKDNYIEMSEGLRELINGYNGLTDKEKRIYYISNKLRFKQYEDEIQHLLNVEYTGVTKETIEELKENILREDYKESKKFKKNEILNVVEDEDSVRKALDTKPDYYDAEMYMVRIISTLMLDILWVIIVTNFRYIDNSVSELNPLLSAIITSVLGVSSVISSLGMLVTLIFAPKFIYDKEYKIFGKGWKENYYKHFGDGTRKVTRNVTRNVTIKQLELNFAEKNGVNIEDFISTLISKKQEYVNGIKMDVLDHMRIQGIKLDDLENKSSIS